MTTTNPITEIDISKVEKAYNGKSHRCMCGCEGKWSYTEESVKNAGDVSMRSVKTTIGKILRSGVAIRESNYIYAEVGSRIYAVYFKEAA